MDATYYAPNAWTFTSRTLYSSLTRRLCERAGITSLYFRSALSFFFHIYVIAWLFGGVSWIFKRLRFWGKQPWWSFEHVTGAIADFRMWLLIPRCPSVSSCDTTAATGRVFFWGNLLCRLFTVICPEIPSLFNVGLNNWHVTRKPGWFYDILAEFLSAWENFHIELVEKVKTRISY